MVEHHIIPPFTSTWWIGLIVSALVIWGIIQYGKSQSPKKEAQFSFILGIVLILREIVREIYLYSINTWHITDSLPLHLCGISSIIAGLILIYRNQFWLEFILILGIPGAVHSFLTPELTHGHDAYLLFEYYFSHSGIILSGFYLVFVHRMSPRLGSWKNAFWVAQGLLIFIGLMNLILKSNYMYLSKKPLVSNPLIIGEWPFYLLGFEIAGLVHILLFYSFFIWVVKKNPAKVTINKNGQSKI
ncbi:MAG: TIGR02206 family membrane protein [Candidatus Marinimicrobia bacterium]|nr:TIGR02206 family membrane protein [Candidatus Neomarinimicrobiota bacterium]MBT4383870.1 TIGR02206 family membrane protein [Candidatus Neomarinimicrobiota bacterium]MBT6937116.1 TIGR02206 family membrane protein [Candidatus Neomarinimicrobiota bacterium]